MKPATDTPLDPYWPDHRIRWDNEPGIGECLRSAWATLMGATKDADVPPLGALPVGDIPEDGQHTYNVREELQRWLHGHGHTAVSIRPEAFYAHSTQPIYCIANGVQRESGLYHAVVWRTAAPDEEGLGSLIHDPNPSRTGILFPQWFDFPVSLSLLSGRLQ